MLNLHLFELPIEVVLFGFGTLLGIVMGLIRYAPELLSELSYRLSEWIWSKFL